MRWATLNLKSAIELLPPTHEELYADAIAKYSAYINYLTEVLPVWSRIAKLPTGTLQVSQIPGIREDGWICLTATGLNVIGRVGHKLISTGLMDSPTDQAEAGRQAWKQYVQKLATIDWKRGAAIWQGNIVQGNRLVTQQSPLKQAFKKVAAAIGLPGYTEPAPAEETGVVPAEETLVGWPNEPF
jgi:hypothetical protein